MSYKHGFFRLNMKNDGTYLILYPPQNGGRIVTLEEIVNYLTSIKIGDYDLSSLKNVIHDLTIQKEIKLNNAVIPEVNERLNIVVSDDAMKAVGRFYPPSMNGKVLSIQDIRGDLIHAGIKYGIVEENIEKFVQNRQYCCNIILAKGKEVVEGKSASISYCFNTDLSLKPKLNDNGTVDFHQLEIISHVNKGDILAVLTPMDLGESGTTVYGKEIKPKKGNNKILKHGKNIYLSEDGLTMYSNVSGHVSLQEDKVFVSDTFEVLTDVGASTGDIDYDGNVTVKGNIISGFTVKAKGDIIVEGVVEGATLIAGGQIILKRGIQGMNKGSLTAEGNIVTKFIENSTVNTKGYLTTEAVMHSKVYAKGDITIGGKRGFVIGGELKSGTMISAMTIGSTMGTATTLEVGVDPSIIEEFKNLENEIANLKAEKDKMIQILSLLKRKKEMGEEISRDKIEYIQSATKTNDYINNRLIEAKIRYDNLKHEINHNESGRVKISGTVFSGVKIIISNLTYYVRSELSYCQFVRDKAEIKIIALT